MSGRISDSDRERFDAILERVLTALPRGIRRVLDGVALVVDDEPDAELLRSLSEEYGEDFTGKAEEFCGLHTARPFTERSHEDGPEVPGEIYLFRLGIIEQAGGWGDEAAIAEEIRITVLHEIGHQFGLDEDDLERLGYE